VLLLCGVAEAQRYDTRHDPVVQNFRARRSDMRRAQKQMRLRDLEQRKYQDALGRYQRDLGEYRVNFGHEYLGYDRMYGGGYGRGYGGGYNHRGYSREYEQPYHHRPRQLPMMRGGGQRCPPCVQTNNQYNGKGHVQHRAGNQTRPPVHRGQVQQESEISPKLEQCLKACRGKDCRHHECINACGGNQSELWQMICPVSGGN